MNIITIFSIVLIVLAILPLFMVLIKMRRLKAFKQKAVTTTATITNIEKRRGFKNNTYYVLTLEYRTIDMTKTFTSHSITTKKYIQGNTIPLMYLPENPAKFSIDSGKGYPYMIAITLILFGLIVWFCYWLNNLEYTGS
ncbi:MAG TPA: DUF3592 domain-containing protein [Ferruginibacter sp.]|nr:DUF3592 domain-containing protein [Ferruginibacter sp.]